MADQILSSQITLLSLLSVLSIFVGLLTYWAWRAHTTKCQRLIELGRESFLKKIENIEYEEPDDFDYPINSWRGFQPFKVIEKKVETWTQHRGEKVSDICSFVLAPINTPTPLPSFHPGQHLSFSLPLNDGLNVRYYSLSDGPHPDHYRVSIKRALPPRNAGPEVPPGLGSNHFHDKIQLGETVLTGQPAGDFCLDFRTKKSGPVVLLAGGIGITPMVSISKMLNGIDYDDPVYLFYGVRGAHEVALIDDLILVSRELKNINVYLCISGATEEVPDITKHEYIHAVTGINKDGSPTLNEPGKGCRLSADLLKSIVDQPNLADYYLCGPPPMMKSLVDGLYFWGMERKRVHWEGFGPCAVNWPGDILNSPLKPCLITVVDKQKDDEKVHVDWSPAKGSVLNLADQHKDKIRPLRRQCGQGACGQCKATLKGSVSYEKKPSFTGLKSNECLTCCARPNGDILIYLQ